jgi:hypothetical protein
VKKIVLILQLQQPPQLQLPQLPQLQFNVTNNGSVNYVINGAENPPLELMEGQTYTFNINAVGHPFWIKTVSSTGTGDAYNSGVTNNGTDNGTISFVVPYDVPSTLYYNCQFHIGMAGTIAVEDVLIPITTTTTTTAAPTTTTTTTIEPVSLRIYIRDVAPIPEAVTLYAGTNGDIPYDIYGPAPLPLGCELVYTMSGGLSVGDTVQFSTDNLCAMDGNSGISICPPIEGGSAYYTTPPLESGANDVSLTIQSDLLP